MTHNPFEVAETLAPLPERDAAADQWARHYLALSFAAYASLYRNVRDLPPNPERGSRPDIGHLAILGHTALSVAVALTHTEDSAGPAIWDLTPEAGAFNGEWEEWLVEQLDLYGINPADINPAYEAGDFRSPSRAEVAR
jgi:hypothetical protein